MAERRMFAKTIIDSDSFLDMPCSSQCLYFHLAMRADDDGFINNPKKIQRMISCSDDDLRLLAAKKFIIPFDSGIVVIKHWKIHNYIQKDRYKETVYQEERSMITANENGSYTLVNEPCIQNVYKLDTQDRLGKVRLGKVSLGEVRQEDMSAKAASYDYDSVKEIYNTSCKNLPNCRALTEKRKKAIRSFLKEFSLEQWKEICSKANQSGFLTGENDRGWKADIDFLLKPDKAARTLEGGYSGKEKGSGGSTFEPGQEEIEAIRQLMGR